MIGTGIMIRQAREASGLSQRQLGQLLGVSAAAVCQWESPRANPRVSTLVKVAGAMGFNLQLTISPPPPTGAPFRE